MRSTVALTVCVLCLTGGICPADDLETAREALRDGLWQTARRHAGKVDSEESRLVVLESYAQEGDWKGASKAMESWTNAVGDVYDYYRAAAKGDYFKALEILKRLPAYGESAPAKMFEADIVLKSGRRQEAERLWREVVAMTNVDERSFAVAGANLADEGVLRISLASARRVSVRRLAGLRLGRLLLKDAARREEGERLIRSIVKDSPDTAEAMEAFLAVAEAAAGANRHKEALDAYHEAMETWPEVSRNARVQELRGWTCVKLGRLDEALGAFKRAEEHSTQDEDLARAILKQGDVYSEMGKGEQAMARYRDVLERFPETAVAGKLRKAVKIRELESEGRDLYKSFRFAEAIAVFNEISALDPSRKSRMDFYCALCLYGQGMDSAALAKAREVSQASGDAQVRADAVLWTAKFLYNRGEWKEAGELFCAYAGMRRGDASAVDALIWAARSAAAAGDFQRAVTLATDSLKGNASALHVVRALIVQGEALMELARFDEAVLVLERAARTDGVPMEERLRARVLKGDALFATGADSSDRYLSALESYRAVRFDASLTASGRICVAFKIAKALEKLKRTEEAIDQYYTEVVLAYRRCRLRGERLDDAAKAAFSRAAFRLADEHENSGRDYQALHILELVKASDVPAAEEAGRRIDRLTQKGMFP